jgi:hypothetical protein
MQPRTKDTKQMIEPRKYQTEPTIQNARQSKMKLEAARNEA